MAGFGLPHGYHPKSRYEARIVQRTALAQCFVSLESYSYLEARLL